MDKTKSDVSAGVVKLDLQAARSTAKLAVSRLVREINVEMRKLQRLDESSPNLDVSAAKHICNAAEHLVTATETRRAIEYIEDREAVEIVNRNRITLYRTEHGMPLCPACGNELRVNVDEQMVNAPFSVEEDDELIYKLAGSYGGARVIKTIRCKRSPRHVWLDNVEDRLIAWITVESQDELKEMLDD